MSARGVLALGWVGCLLAFVAAVPAVPPAVRFLPFGASLVLFGLPHGAADHLVPAWLADRPVRRSAAAVGVLYAVVGLAYAVVWVLAPAVAFVGFIALTWYHWGQGDLYAMASLAGADHLRSRTQRLAAIAVRGGLPMAVPLAAFPETYRRVAAATVAPFGATVPAWLFAPPTTRGVAAGFGVLVAAALGVGFVRARGAPRPEARRHWAVDAAETTLLAVYFAVVPPVLSVGTYFTLWHSTRHIARLAALADDGAAGVDAAGLWAFARGAAPLTVVSLALVAAVAALVRPTTLFDALGVYLLVIAVLTAPHTAVVTWMDSEQRLWLSRAGRTGR